MFFFFLEEERERKEERGVLEEKRKEVSLRPAQPLLFNIRFLALPRASLLEVFCSLCQRRMRWRRQGPRPVAEREREREHGGGPEEAKDKKRAKRHPLPFFFFCLVGKKNLISLFPSSSSHPSTNSLRSVRASLERLSSRA